MDKQVYVAAIKAQLASDLEKVGSSLFEFEKALASIHTPEGAVKVARDMTGLLAGNLKFDGLADMAYKSSIGAGGIAGLLLDNADASLDPYDDAVAQMQKKIKMYRDATKNWQREQQAIQH